MQFQMHAATVGTMANNCNLKQSAQRQQTKDSNAKTVQT